MTDDFVTQSQCKEFRSLCTEARKNEREIGEKAQDNDRDSRDDWINKIERKIDWLIGIIVVQTISVAAGLLYILLSHLLGGL